MKRIFWLLAIPALFLSACNGDKGDAPLVINPYDLVGVWDCTDHIDPSGEHSPEVASLASMVISINSLTHYAPYYGGGKFEYGTMKTDGDILTLEGQYDEEETFRLVCKIMALDGKHLTWMHSMEDEDRVQESYINVTRILPGTWKVNYPDGSTTATIDAKGNFVEEYPTDPPQVVNCEWLLYNKNGYVVIHIWEVNKDADTWETEFAILSISDDRIETKQAVTNDTVVFERQ